MSLIAFGSRSSFHPSSLTHFILFVGASLRLHNNAYKINIRFEITMLIVLQSIKLYR
jgi:hypothetical protein